MKRSKKIVIGTLCISLLAASAIGGTMAFLTDTEEVTNHFSVGDLDIKIEEPGWEDGDEETPGDGEDLVPGDTKEKDPTITAVTNDSYMRVIMSVQDREGNPITDKERLDLILKTVYYDADLKISEGKSYSLEDLKAYKMVNSDFTLTKTEGSEFTYTYNNILKESEEAVLFTDIVIPTDWNQTHMKVLDKYQIVLQAQAIQTDNFKSADEAFAALDAEIKNGTVQENYATVGSATIK